MDDEERLSRLPADGVFADLQFRGKGRELLGLRGRVRALGGQRGEHGEQNESKRGESLKDAHGVECIARLLSGCGTLSA